MGLSGNFHSAESRKRLPLKEQWMSIEELCPPTLFRVRVCGDAILTCGGLRKRQTARAQRKKRPAEALPGAGPT